MKRPTHAELIVWQDHHEPDKKDTWDEPTPPDHLAPVLVYSAGFVVSENATMLELARDWEQGSSAGAFLQVIKKCIVIRKRIALPRLKKKGPALAPDG